MGKYAIKSGLLLVALLSSQWLLAGENLYRYKDKSGDVVIDDDVPPEFVAGGYEVLSRTGRVVEVVAAAEVKKKVDPQQAGETEDDKAAQRKEDAMLLRSFSELADLEAARDRRLRLLDRDISIVDSNLLKSRELLKISRAKAANYQRGGKVVPEMLLKNISKLAEQVQDAEQMKSVRNEERRVVGEKYQRYIERFIVLKGLEKGSDRERNHPSKLAIDPASSQ